jgi:predicted lactoylglutathione lyase
MTTTPRMIFVNLSVQDLPRSMEFFRRLGFEFDPRFTDDKAACMILSDKGFVMLLSRPFFETFTKRKVCDNATHTETMLALSCESRSEVDELVAKAIEGGGSHAMDKMDHGFMYGWSFYDPDGHHWEVVWMDPKAVTEGPHEQKS